MPLTNDNVQSNSKEPTIIELSTENYPTWMFWKKRRCVVAMMAFWGFFNVYALRVNLSIAVVAMTENKTVTLENGTITYEREFDWDSKLQGYILSSFFYGYITTQLLGGWIASKIGGKKMNAVGIGATAALTLITPWLVRVNVYLLLTIRIIEGILEGLAFPSMHALWSRWAPPLERSQLTTLGISGSYVGTVVAMPVCAYLAKSLGWPSIFYFFGGIALVWVVAWIFIVTETPEEDPYISKAELRYITAALGNVENSKKPKVPWKNIFKSIPVWAIVVSHFTENWGFYTLMTQLPKFLKDILNFDLGKTGYMSAIPYLVIAIMMQFSGKLADWCQAKRYLTTTQVRRIFNCGGFLAQAVFILGAAFWLSPTESMICLTLSMAFGSLTFSGFYDQNIKLKDDIISNPTNCYSVNHLDIAPQYASILLGFSNTFGTLPGIFSPIISGYIVTTPTAGEWRVVFYITSALYIFGSLFYGLFASGELQPWTTSPEVEEEVLLRTNKLNWKKSKI